MIDRSAALGARAVVLGASLAGLLAARVLAERFSEVVLLERDELPDGPAPRKGTPHAVHPHGLLARGREALEEIFPGFTQSLVERGAMLGDLQRDIAFDAGGQRFAVDVAGLPGLAVSRLAIEAELRARVLVLPNVRLVEDVDVLGLCFDAGSQRVTGARYALRAGDRRELQIDAALTLDCTGRASRTSEWLAAQGYPAPEQEKIQIGICYTSAYFERSGELSFGGQIHKAAVISTVTNALPRPGVMIAQEPAEPGGVPRWVVGVGGYTGDHPAPTIAGLRERALAIGSPEMIKITQEGQRIGEVIRYHMPHSQRRRYERLARFPTGYLVMGDALTSFNPIYGQGMTVVACESLALRDALDKGLERIAPRFFRAASRIVDIPWQLAAGGDLAIDAVPGPRPLPVRLVNAYIARLYRVAPGDAVLSRAFLKVVHMLERPQTLFAPSILWRVLRGPRRASAALTPWADAGTARAASR